MGEGRQKPVPSPCYHGQVATSGDSRPGYLGDDQWNTYNVHLDSLHRPSSK